MSVLQNLLRVIFLFLCPYLVPSASCSRVAIGRIRESPSCAVCCHRYPCCGISRLLQAFGTRQQNCAAPFLECCHADVHRLVNSSQALTRRLLLGPPNAMCPPPPVLSYPFIIFRKCAVFHVRIELQALLSLLMWREQYKLWSSFQPPLRYINGCSPRWTIRSRTFCLLGCCRKT
jgi:hypothetical protein